MLSKCSIYVHDLAKKNGSVVMPGKKGLWGLKMLFTRRNTTSLTKFHPLTLHTSPNSSKLTKHRTCEATVVKKSIYRNQGRKSKPDFYGILFVMPEDVSIGGNGIRFVI
jgi:hypothetical protein